MNKQTTIILSTIAFLLGLVGAFTSPIISFVGIFVFIALLFFLTDYSRAVYILAFFFIIDFVIRNILPIPSLVSIWDEVFLIGTLVLFIVKYIFSIKLKKHIFTPIDIPMIIFILVNVFILIVNSTYIQVGLEGFRAVTTNLLWFFLVFSLLKNKKDAKKVLMLITFSSLLIAFYGIYQYITGVEMPDGWIDMAEKGVSTRAFSFVQSPNILGAIMTLTSMVALGLFFYDKKVINKVIYSTSFLIMVACLVFTLSRGAWIGFGVSLLIFVFFKDKRFILPLVAIGIISILFIPTVSSRVIYMLSPEYMVSSLSGGRMQRWITGFAIFKDNLLLGKGLGHFGGAVAMHHPYYFPDAFYMDNNYLKIAVESGIFGLLSFVSLIYITLSSIFKRHIQKAHTPTGDLLLALFAGLSGISVHCFFENIFEVPGMIILFWLIAAVSMVIIYKENDN